MKNVVVLVNGTWNDSGTDKQEQSLLTNVVWLKDLCDSEQQHILYIDGVGTGNLLDRALGGAFGFRLSKSICTAYRLACEAYEPGAKIYFFGFSRGAYTVRTVADMIAKIGLADLRNVNKISRDDHCKELLAVYRGKKQIADVPKAAFFNTDDPAAAKGTTPVHFVGVWDTVGTAGIPDHYKLLNRFDKVSNNHNWANTQLDEAVLNGRHAVGMDEQREAFVPAFWTDENGVIVNDDRITQLWFSGVHSDIGGGYENRDLGNIAMRWMFQEATGKGLIPKENPDRPIPADRAMGTVNNSLSSVFKRMWTRPRGVPNVFDPDNEALFHPSVLRRYNHPECPSRPSWGAEDFVDGNSIERAVWAKDHWTSLGVYIRPGRTYEITADGHWYDLTREYDPEGNWKNRPQIRAATLFDVHHIPNMLSRLARRGGSDDQYRRVLGAWRSPNSVPFMLMGLIANGAGVVSDGKNILPERHTEFEIGKGTVIGPGTGVDVSRGGYLYCYPNDVWNRYSNNEGQLAVTITRK